MDKFKNKYFGYIEGVIYIILIIVIIFASITGPILIKLLPLVFVLGLVGRIVFNRPVITSIFGFLVSICTIYIIGTYSFEYNLMYSLFCFICILMGEVEGMYLIRLLNKKRNNIEKSNFKNITAIIVLALAGIFLNNYFNGNIYTYLKYKHKIENYISSNYPNSNNFKISEGKFVFTKYKYYSFNVKNIDDNDNTTYKFAVYLDDNIIDGYENSRLSLNSAQLKNEFSDEIDLSKYTDFEFDIKYNDLKNNITVYITKSVDKISSDQLNNFAEDVNNILENISIFNKFSNISKINICIEDAEIKLDAEIYSSNFYDKKYYINSLETEYIDE
ncbi:MAG: hypothetical protein PHD15_03490 [Clostridia bacterium]|nr:hypothetical protein [Clostridia bacterium]MDD4386805.1 hypothetical protein [Clostridia bacterium]